MFTLPEAEASCILLDILKVEGSSVDAEGTFAAVCDPHFLLLQLLHTKSPIFSFWRNPGVRVVKSSDCSLFNDTLFENC